MVTMVTMVAKAQPRHPHRIHKFISTLLSDRPQLVTRLCLRFCDPAAGETAPLARQSLEDSAFQGGALERGIRPVAFSEQCLYFLRIGCFHT